MSTESNTDELEHRSTTELTRRELMRGAATAGAGAVTLHAVDDTHLDPTGEARAAVGVGTVIVAASAGAFVGGAVMAHLSGDSGTKDPEEAAKQTAKESLQLQMYDDIVDREEINRNTILSTESLLQGLGTLDTDQGLARLAFEEAQVKIDEAIKAGKTQSEVQQAGKNEAMKKIADAQEQIIAYWQASADEFQSYLNTINSEGWNRDNFVNMLAYNGATENWTDSPPGDSGSVSFKIQTNTVTLADGREKEVTQYYGQIDYTLDQYPFTAQWHGGGNDGNTPGRWETQMSELDTEKILFLESADWESVYSKTEQMVTDLETEIDTWVNTLYEQSQAGELDLQEYVPPSVWRTRAVEESDAPQAIADLLAMNVPVDMDRKMTITYAKNGIDWTASGWFAATKNPDSGYTTGTTYEAQSQNVGNVYMTVHYSDLVGAVPSTEYQSGIDGGIVTLTTAPREGTNYTIVSNKTNSETGEPEQVTIPASEFSENSNGNWEVDLSGQLENPIAEVDSITATIPEPQTEEKYIQIVVEGTFTVDSITNEKTGESVDQATVEAPETSSPTEWRDSEDFQQAQQRREEFYDRMLERFEEVEGDDGGGGGWPGIPGADNAKAVFVAIVAVFGGIAALNAASG